MSTLKRLPIKYIRDYIKKDYKLRDECYICGTKDDLELHHLFSLSQLFEHWCKENNIDQIDTVEDMNAIRADFAVDCEEKLSHKHLYTLCGKHHKQLHTIYGQKYSNYFAPKIKKWLDIQKDKHGK